MYENVNVLMKLKLNHYSDGTLMVSTGQSDITITSLCVCVMCFYMIIFGSCLTAEKGSICALFRWNL